jgi:hypothetical protein
MVKWRKCEVVNELYDDVTVVERSRNKVAIIPKKYYVWGDIVVIIAKNYYNIGDIVVIIPKNYYNIGDIVVIIPKN